MNRNGKGPEDKGPGTGWGQGYCLSDEEMKNREESWNGRAPQGRGRSRAFGGRGMGSGMGRGRGMGAGRGRGHGFGRGMNCGFRPGLGRGNEFTYAVDIKVLERLSTLEEAVRELTK